MWFFVGIVVIIAIIVSAFAFSWCLKIRVQDMLERDSKNERERLQRIIQTA
jgi:signal transduction histidine kinase